MGWSFEDLANTERRERVAGGEMTDEQKIEALTDLLDSVIFYLDMTKYLIDDPDKASSVIREANKFHQQMLDILYPDA